MAKEEFNKNAEENFLTYAGAVIKSRAISNVEDNLKPVTRRILWSLYENKVFADKKTVKCGKIVGDVLGRYHPHGDASVYDALVHLAQDWKMRYPLVYVQGNMGNILGDGPAASRYTECKLSKCGQLMLEDIKKAAVQFRPNYDESLLEPCLLPSIFPNTLCNGSIGIAVGLSASLVPHNVNEVCDGIIAYINNPQIKIEELFKYIKGPDFPEGGIIIDGEKLPEIYKLGRGTVTVRAHYKVLQSGQKIELVFTDLPYQVEIEQGVIKPLKKLIEECPDLIDDYYNNTNEKQVEFHIILNKGVDLARGLAAIFEATKLEQTIKINNTVLVQGEPRTLSLIGMIQEYLRHRHNCIINIARNELEKANHHLTIVLGLEKCMSNIDDVIHIIRNADNAAMAKNQLCAKYELSGEQADAVLDMKLSRLSRLDVVDLQDDEKKTRENISNQTDLIENAVTRENLIKSQLNEIKKQVGDERRTEILVTSVSDTPELIHNFYGYADMVTDIEPPTYGAIACLPTTNIKHIFAYDADGTFYPAKTMQNIKNCRGYGLLGKDYFITVTEQGYIKKTRADFWKDKTIAGVKLKAGDSLMYAGMATDDDYLLVLDENAQVSKIAVAELKEASRLTQGLTTGLGKIVAALIVSDDDNIVVIDNANHGKIVAVKTLSINSRTSKGQKLNESARYLININNRNDVYGVSGKKVIEIPLKKMSVKSKAAGGTTLSGRNIERYF